MKIDVELKFICKNQNTSIDSNCKDAKDWTEFSINDLELDVNNYLICPTCGIGEFNIKIKKIKEKASE